MGTYSYFESEHNISIDDCVFYAYLRRRAKPESAARAILEWYDTFGKPVTYPWRNPRDRWKPRVENGLLRFSFACFNGWRIMGYRFTEFGKILRAMEASLSRSKSGSRGKALFRLEGSDERFCFHIDYAKRKISLRGPGADRDTTRFLQRQRTEIPKSISSRAGKLTELPLPPARRYEQVSLDDLFSRHRKPRSVWRICMSGSTVTREFSRPGKNPHIQRREFRTPAGARRFFYESIRKKEAGDFSEVRRR